MWEQAAAAAGNLIGGFFDRASAKKQASLDREYQLAFAKNAIQWKVEDAQKAGVHPLYALGAPTMNFSPVSVGGGGGFASMGQDLGRAIGAGMSKQGQLTAFDAAVQDLTLKKFGLENELLAAQIARMKNEMLMKPSLPGVAKLTMPGGARFTPGASSKAQTVQDEYGDIVENIYGLARLGYDAYTNSMRGYRQNVQKYQGQYGPDGLLINPRRARQIGRR